jgi:hypothetical protein
LFPCLAFLWRFYKARESLLFVPKHVRLCLRKNRGLIVLPLQDCWSQHRGLWKWHCGG